MILNKDTRLAIEMFAVAMDTKLDRKQKQYGDSWEDCDLEFLRDRLVEEFKEWKTAELSDETTELVDIANICMMLWYRLNELEPPRD